MDPVTAATAALGAIQAGLSISKDLTEMNDEQRVNAGTHTLAMLLLETEINLALLDTVPATKKKEANVRSGAVTGAGWSARGSV